MVVVRAIFKDGPAEGHELEIDNPGPYLSIEVNGKEYRYKVTYEGKKFVNLKLVE